MNIPEALEELRTLATSHEHKTLPHSTLPYTQVCHTCKAITVLIEDIKQQSTADHPWAQCGACKSRKIAEYRLHSTSKLHCIRCGHMWHEAGAGG